MSWSKDAGSNPSLFKIAQSMIEHQLGPIPIASFFNGAGGLDYGFVRAGFVPVVAIDHDRAATATFNFNFAGKVAQNDDIAKLSPETLIEQLEQLPNAPQGVIGGPPCQGFSISNTRSSVDDPRNLLPFRYCEIIDVLNQRFGLRFFLFENVLGLRSPKHRDRLAEIVLRFERAGFAVMQAELNASRFGVPQQRRRLFLVGVNREMFPRLTFRMPTGSDKIQTVRSAIGDLPEPIFRESGLAPKDIPFHPNHWTSQPCSKRFASQDFNKGRSFRRLDWDEPSWTVAYGNREIHIHPNGRRRLSIFEAMLLQSFPKKFVITGTFSQQVQQVSNAVPPRVAQAVASAIRKQLF